MSNATVASPAGTAIASDLSHNLWDFSDLILKSRFARALADGVVRAQGRKIIFSTNLPNIGDLDDALIRPGRCFAHVMARELFPAESERLLGKLCSTDPVKRQAALERLNSRGGRSVSLAAIYQTAAA